MKKMIFTLIALASMTMAMAQNSCNCNCHCGPQGPRGPKPMTVEMRTEMMAKRLELSPEQTVQLKELNEQYKDIFMGPGRKGLRHPHMGMDRKFKNGAPEMTQEMKEDMKKDVKKEMPKAMKKEMKAKMKAKMKEMKAKHEEYDKKLKSILSDSQYKSYQQMKPKHGGKHHRKGMPRPQAPEA